MTKGQLDVFGLWSEWAIAGAKQLKSEPSITPEPQKKVE
jgi:hypothetical protein